MVNLVVSATVNHKNCTRREKNTTVNCNTLPLFVSRFRMLPGGLRKKVFFCLDNVYISVSCEEYMT